MKQLLNQLDARLRRAASRLDAAYAALAPWSAVSTVMTSVTVVDTKPGFMAIPTATDVHARRPQEPSP
jgi:hypothetical protein